MKGPSPHLSWAELGCKDGTPYPEAWRSDRAVQLARVFEVIRRVCGAKPIIVTSAYRTAAYNAQVGGAGGSQHVQGRALDLKPPDGLSVADFHHIIVTLAQQRLPELGGVGRYPSWVHVDIRPRPENGYLAQWVGR